jgi:hypothetical protein
MIMTAKQLRKKYTRVSKINGHYRAQLIIGNQTFTVCDDRPKDEAEWYRDMLVKALETLREELGIEEGRS